MRIKVKTHGHQHYSEVVGEVVMWCSAVEKYTNSPPLQVPAVLIDRGTTVELVVLQKELYWTQVEVIQPDSAGDSNDA